MPKVTPELLREMAKREYQEARHAEMGSGKQQAHLSRASAFCEVEAMLESEARDTAFLVIPHDPNYHCWGK